jgi:hypothetical protein
MFSFFRRRKEADANARRIIDQGRFLGARTPREAVEMLWGRPLSENEWVRYASVWERIWGESLKERPIESEMRPPYQLRLAISAVTDEPQWEKCDGEYCKRRRTVDHRYRKENDVNHRRR